MDLSSLPAWVRNLASLGAAGGAGAGGIRMLERLFTMRPNDIPICTTRVMRSGRGWPWNKQIALHPLKDGRIEMKFLEP